MSATSTNGAKSMTFCTWRHVNDLRKWRQVNGPKRLVDLLVVTFQVVGPVYPNFTVVLHNQLIRGGLEHYVCLIGTQFMLQVKYRKTTMIKFDICGQTVMLYEVAYIAVPSLLQDAKITDKEVEKLDKTRIEEI